MSSAEGQHFESYPESTEIQNLRNEFRQFFIEQGERVEILYDTHDQSRAVVRFWSGSMPSVIQNRFTSLDIAYWSNDEEESTAISIGSEQYLIDRSGARHADNPSEELDQQTIYQLLACITPGNALWSSTLTRLSANKLFDLHKMMDR